MGRMYGTNRLNRSKYAPSTNSSLVEEARRPKNSVVEGSGAGDVVPSAVDVHAAVGSESAVDPEDLPTPDEVAMFASLEGE